MKHPNSPTCRQRRLATAFPASRLRHWTWVAGLLGWLLAGAGTAQAQTLSWLSASSLNPTAAAGTSTVQAVATDSLGIQYVTGSFTGTLTLGSTTLTSAGGTDVFVAARSATGTWQWAKSAGGTGNEVANAIAVAGNGPAAQVFLTGSYTATATFGGTTLSAATAGGVFVAALLGSGSWTWAEAGGSNTLATLLVGGYGIAVAGRGSTAVVYVTGVAQSIHFGSVGAPSRNYSAAALARQLFWRPWMLPATVCGAGAWVAAEHLPARPSRR